MELNIEEVQTTDYIVNMHLYGGNIYGCLDNNDELIEYITGLAPFSGDIKLSSAKQLHIYFRKLGFVPKLNVLNNTYLTVGKELTYIASLCCKKPETIIKKMEQALTLVGLDVLYLNRKFITLSTSERILINIALAIIKNPDLLIIDSVLSYLNKEQKNNIINLLKQFKKRGKIVIIFDDNLDLLYEISNKLWIINQNKVYSKSSIIKELDTFGIKYLPSSLLFTTNYNNKTDYNIKPTYELNDILKAVYRDE